MAAFLQFWYKTENWPQCQTLDVIQLYISITQKWIKQEENSEGSLISAEEICVTALSWVTNNPSTNGVLLYVQVCIVWVNVRSCVYVLSLLEVKHPLSESSHLTRPEKHTSLFCCYASVERWHPDSDEQDFPFPARLLSELHVRFKYWALIFLWEFIWIKIFDLRADCLTVMCM